MNKKQAEFYSYKGRIYVLLDEIQVKHPTERNWFIGALYADESGNKYTRDLSEFYERFSSYLFPTQREALETVFNTYHGSKQ